MNLPLPAPGVEPDTVLVADDDTEARAEIATRLRARGYRVEELADGRQLADRLLGVRPTLPTPQVVIAEMFLPGVSGLETCASAHDTGLSVSFILTTSVPSDELRDEARRSGATAVFDKPIALDRLVDAVGEIVHDKAE